MKHTRTVRGKYYDSVTLMLAATEVRSIEDVTDASLVMATKPNLKILESAGYDTSTIAANPSDLVIALDCKATDPEELFEKVLDILERPSVQQSDEDMEYFPRSIDGALSVFPDANIALISVAGQFAGDVARDCLENGLNVVIYSDNVPLETEIELKLLASELGLLVMGPDCGTVIVRGVGIGFANVCPPGPVGIVAAAGTGLQEVHVQLARRGVGVLHGLGTGGRDVKEEVNGVSFISAMDALIQDEEVTCLVLVGKPPSVNVLEEIVRKSCQCLKPVVTAFLGENRQEDNVQDGLFFCDSLEEAAAVAAALVEGTDIEDARNSLDASDPEVSYLCRKKASRKGFLRGLFSGGTLAYEAQAIAQSRLGPVYSNSPLNPDYKLSDSLKPLGNCIIDYGEDEFTQGRLHPMIDLTLRCEKLVEQVEDSDVGVILIDVVLGYGSHPDPASKIVEAVRGAKTTKRPLMIAYVCGTDDDPQNAGQQRKILEDEGFVVCKSNAQAARLACEFAFEE